MRFEAFNSGTYQSWSANFAAERSINLYPELREVPGGKGHVALFSTPGLEEFCVLPTAPVRGLWAGEGRLFAVAGSKLYEVFNGDPPTYVDKGDVGDDLQHTPAQIWPNGVQLMIVSAGKMYVHTGVEIIQPVFHTATGRVNSGGADVLRIYGDEFGSWMVGSRIVINDIGYTVATVVDKDNLTITGTTPTQYDKEYSIAPGGDATADGTLLVWHAGDLFFPTMVGHPINVSGTTRIVATYEDDHHIRLTTEAGSGPVLWYALPPVTARTGTFLDGYFIVAPADSKQFFFSASYDGKVWNPLEFSVKESYPDNISAIYSDHQELWVFGTHHSIEVWRNEGDPDAAGGFRRDPGAAIHCALVAPWSPCSLASGLHFLGGDTRGRIVAYRAQGFQPVRVSTHAVEQAWNSYETVWDAYGFTYIDQGHQYWVLNFQTADATWVYDMASQMWHERAHWDGSAFHKHRGRCHAYAFDRHLVGDHTTGQIYEMSHAFYDDDGAPIRRVRQAPHIQAEQNRVFSHKLQLELEITGTAPAVALDWSDDDGATFTAPRPRPPSISGAKKGRVIWRRLGSSRDRIYRVTISDPVKVAIADAFLTATPGTS